ncbi:MAG: histone-lysine N-methyltransferase [Oligoflexia bacterium]|nr:histone-lysine N-methyltransferase [Oligoflexia bacterium]
MFKLNDVKEPQLFRKLFPFDEVPRLTFDNEYILPALPENVWITDTTFRDGQQSRPPYLVEQIVQLYKYLHKLSGPKGLVRVTEFFLYSKKDREAVDKCRDLGYKFPIITGWIRANKEDFKLVKEMKIEETGILTSVSDYHIFLKLKKTRKQVMTSYLEIVSAALDAGITPRCHLEDITRADFFGFVIPFVRELMELQRQSGIPIKIRACDTMGYGVSFPNATLPRSVPKIINSLIKYGEVPSEQLEWHGHNDLHKVHVNSVAAWLYGCCAVNTSLLGIGERTGNSPLEAAVIEYLSLFGNKKMKVDTTVITEIGEYFENELNYKIPNNYPFLGKDFNTTRAGIHADGIIKNKEIYSVFNTEKLLNRTLDVSIADKTGVASIAHWINTHLLKSRKMVDSINKRHPGIKRINDWIEKQYLDGRTTIISNEEMTEQVKIHMPELVESDFDKLYARVEMLALGILEEILERPEIKTMDPVKIEPILLSYDNMYHFMQFMYVINTKGERITSNITQKEYKKKYDNYAFDLDFSNRKWFKEPIRTKKPHVSDFYTSLITGELCFTVSAPIIDDDKKILGVIGIDIMFEELAAVAPNYRKHEYGE